MSTIQVKNLSFAYEGTYEPVFSDVNLLLDSDWKLGLIGRNGRGKTTFLNLLREMYPYEGSITKSVQFQYFPMTVSDESQITYDIMKKICPNAEDWEMIKELSLLDVETTLLYGSFGLMSKGEQNKVLLAALFLSSNAFLLIDEPTNHLDASSREIVETYLRKKSGFILVSHDRQLLDCCVNHILSINKADIELQKGSFSSWWENTKRKNQNEVMEYEKWSKSRKRLLEASRQSANWSDKVERSKKGGNNSGSKLDKGYVGHKAAKMMKRSKTIETRQQKALEMTRGLLKNVELEEELELCPLKYRSEQICQLSDIQIEYGSRMILQQFNLEIRQGDRIALVGKNGSGKSSILKLICGEDIPFEGKVRMGNGLVISYLPQDTKWLKGSIHDFAEKWQLKKHIFQTLLHKLGIERVEFEKSMEGYSEGQKKKVLIAKSLCENAHLYIWDEPLNYIDIYSKLQIESLILEYQPTLLFVEHDAMFCEKIATKRVKLHS